MILVAIVRYGSEGVVERFVASANGHPQVRFAIADNGPDHGLTTAALADVDGVHTVTSSLDNPGYVPAAFAAAAHAIEMGSHPEWVVVSNCDLSVPWTEFCEMLGQYRVDEPLAVAPSVVDLPEGVPKNPHLEQRPSRARLGRVKMATRSAFGFAIYQGLHTMRSRARMQRRSHTVAVPSPVYAAHGSVVALNRTLFDLLLPSAQRALLFSEEIWLAEACRMFGAPIIFDPACRIDHHAHSVTSQISSRAHREAWKRGAARALEFYDGGGSHG